MRTSPRSLISARIVPPASAYTGWPPAPNASVRWTWTMSAEVRSAPAGTDSNVSSYAGVLLLTFTGSVLGGLGGVSRRLPPAACTGHGDHGPPPIGEPQQQATAPDRAGGQQAGPLVSW